MINRREINKASFNTLLALQKQATVKEGCTSTGYAYTAYEHNGVVLKKVQHCSPYSGIFYYMYT